MGTQQDNNGYERHGERASQSSLNVEGLDFSRLPPRYTFAFVALKYFGFPVLVACVFGWWIYRQDEQNRADREADRAAFVQAIDRNTAQLADLVDELKKDR